MLSEPAIQLLMQIPLVGIFVWFTLNMTKTQAAAQEKRDADWRAFLREQREVNHEALMELTREIKSISTLMMQHDQRVQAAIPQMDRAIESLERKTQPRRGGG